MMLLLEDLGDRDCLWTFPVEFFCPAFLLSLTQGLFSMTAHELATLTSSRTPVSDIREG